MIRCHHLERDTPRSGPVLTRPGCTDAWSWIGSLWRRTATVLLMGFWCLGCGPAPTEAPSNVYRTDMAVKAIAPDPVVKIKVRRSVSGGYSWDLAGDSTEAILKADAELRKSLSASGTPSSAETP